MKKIICCVMLMALMVSLCSCGATSTKYNVGGTVSSDIAELTVKKASLGYYAAAASTSTSTGKTANISTAFEPTDKSNVFFKASKGYTLVCLDFVLKNLDRDDIQNYVVSFSVKQNGETAAVMGYDLNMKGGSGNLNLSYASIAYNGSTDFYTSRTMNEIIDPGESVEIKTVGIIGFDADLDAPFELIAELKNSSGKAEKFVYEIN